MKLSNSEVNMFFETLKINPNLRTVSLDFLNLIILKVAEHIPWQNITMIKHGLGKVPSLEDIKKNMLLGNGGICLDINRFMLYFLKKIGYDTHYILCGREKKKKRHIALIVKINNELFFVDCGDAQPYYQAINLVDSKIIKRGKIKYKIVNENKNYQLLINKKNIWSVLYCFNLRVYNENCFFDLLNEYYKNIYYSPFWKEVHFAIYPNKKLRAIKGTTILYETDKEEVVKINHSNIEDYKIGLSRYFSELILNKYDFTKHIEMLRNINLFERFGINITQFECDVFLEKIKISETELSLTFITEFMNKVLSKIPFQNYRMIERGFGHIPTEENIKEDMLSLNGGTCATINTFVGAILYKIGFDVFLIHGTMIKPNDHIALLLNLKNKKYTIDLGDGQPYFSPNLVSENKIKRHAFRTYRTVAEFKNLRIDFFIKNTWSTDVILHLKPKPFKEVYSTLIKHYTNKEYGPFWKGMRFAIYPDSQVIAIRDNLFIIQKESLIEKIKINNERDLNDLMNRFLPNYKEQVIPCFKKLKII